MMQVLRYQSCPALTTRTTSGDLVFVQWIDVQISLGRPGRFQPSTARRDLRTADGRALEYVAKGKYRLASGVCLISQDPNAP